MKASLFIYLFIYFWLCWVFVSVRGLSLAAASGGHSSSRCAGLSLSRPLLLQSASSRRTGSVVVAHGPSCSAAFGIFPDQDSNPCPLHWQADSQPLRHQGSPRWPHFEVKLFFLTDLGFYFGFMFVFVFTMMCLGVDYFLFYYILGFYLWVDVSHWLWKMISQFSSDSISSPFSLFFWNFIQIYIKPSYSMFLFSPPYFA